MEMTPSVLGLSDQQLKHYQTEFKLSYHLNYLHICQQHIPLAGLDVLEVGGALPASLVINHLGCNSWTAIEAPAYDQELGDANQFHRNASDHDNQSQNRSRYRHLYLDIEAIPQQDHYKQYDLIFSIACFEHIHRLPQALKTIYHCLKPGGRLFTMFSPIWSAYDGHHLPIGIPDRFLNENNPDRAHIIQPWGHLLNGWRDTLQDVTRRFDRDFAEEVVYYAFCSNHINRYFTEDYHEAFRSSSFKLDSYQTTFLTPPPDQIQKELEGKFKGCTEFSNNGILAIASRPASASNLVIF